MKHTHTICISMVFESRDSGRTCPIKGITQPFTDVLNMYDPLLIFEIVSFNWL